MAPASTASLPNGRILGYRLTHPQEASRPTILLAGMLSTQGAVWDRVVDVLLDAGFRTLAIDPPGHGASSAPDVPSENTFEAMTDDIASLLPSLLSSSASSSSSSSPPAPLLHAWIGCSLGAATGVVFAARHPGLLRHLVVCDTVSQSPHVAGTPDVFTPRVQAANAAGNLDTILAETRTRWLGDAWLAAHDDGTATPYGGTRAWLTAIMAETTLAGYEACIAPLLSPTFDLGTLAPAVAASLRPRDGRVLLVVGDRDLPLPTTMKVLSDQIRASYAAAGDAAAEEHVQFAVIPEAGHASFVDGYEAWCRVVLPFIQS